LTANSRKALNYSYSSQVPGPRHEGNAHLVTKSLFLFIIV